MPIIFSKNIMDAVFLGIFVALDKTRHLRPVAVPFRKNKVMHRMLNVDTFYILAARGRPARACMQIRILYSTVLETDCKMRHLSRAISPVRSGNPILTSRARPHTQGATSWLSKSEFPGFSAASRQLQYSCSAAPGNSTIVNKVTYLGKWEV